MISKETTSLETATVGAMILAWMVVYEVAIVHRIRKAYAQRRRTKNSEESHPQLDHSLREAVEVQQLQERSMRKPQEQCASRGRGKGGCSTQKWRSANRRS